MKPEYVVRQGSYESPEGFAGGGCTSCTYWTIAAAYKGTTNLNGIKGMKPTDSWTGPVGAANSSSRTNPASIYTASKKYKGEEQYLETIYKNLVNGTPILFQNPFPSLSREPSFLPPAIPSPASA